MDNVNDKGLRWLPAKKSDDGSQMSKGAFQINPGHSHLFLATLLDPCLACVLTLVTDVVTNTRACAPSAQRTRPRIWR